MFIIKPNFRITLNTRDVKDTTFYQLCRLNVHQYKLMQIDQKIVQKIILNGIFIIRFDVIYIMSVFIDSC